MKRWAGLAALLAFALLGGGAVWWVAQPPAPSRTPQVQGRLDATATLLRDGTILVVGGRPPTGGATPIVERFDPRTGLWHDAGRLHTARTHHTASLLPDGSVMVVGGVEGGFWPWQNDGLTSVERYLPAKNRWITLASLPQGVTEHSAVVLPDGRLLIAGGRDRDGVPSHATTAVWAYDLAQNRWQARAPLHLPRAGGVGVALADGRALIIGGVAALYPSLAPSVEVYDPRTNQWQLGPVLGAGFVGYQRAARLTDGRVLVADGADDFLYNPRQDQWSRVASGSPLSTDGTLTALPDGRALLVSGHIQALYDPVADSWQIGQRAIARDWHTATLLPDGRVVLLGGQNVAAVGPGHDVEFVQP
ncbi:MAG TPA: kelch repeat-containing protein [Thermomicrobiales bacterium]|nr:kelch repeat-containing protein [Thermomicrobiales bacterium]